MKKIIIYLLVIPLSIILVLITLHISAFLTPTELLKNDYINGLSDYTGNEKKFGEYAIRQVKLNESYTGAKIIKIHYETDLDTYYCIGNDGSYDSNHNIRAEVQSFGLFGLPRETRRVAGCVNK